MRKFLKSIFKVFTFYLLLFALCRIAFLCYFFAEISSEGAGVIFRSLWHALPLDVSMACYLVLLPMLLLLVKHIAGHAWPVTLLKAYVVFTTVIIVILSVGEIGVYQEVHIKPYYNLLSHLERPDEFFRSITYQLMISALVLMAILIYACIRLFNRLLPGDKTAGNRNLRGIGKGLLLFAVLSALAVIGCRGGIQPIPINEGEVYFSRNQCVNDGTVNPLWNMLHSYIENRKVLQGDIYNVMPGAEAAATFQQVFTVTQDTTIAILKTRRPNVCIIIMESWSADLIESCGGYQGITPNFEKLIKEGYLFTHTQAAGHVSDQGIPAILSGYPAMPIGSVINQPSKHRNLPCINRQLQQQGYYSSFFFGGQLIYGGIKGYIYYNKFNRVVEQQSLPAGIPAGRLGIHDSTMLAIWKDSLNSMPQPFFSCLFTLSTHSPFDAPMGTTIQTGDREDEYLNSAVYADRQLGIFFEQAKKQPWYSNTVFILVADHSHNVPKNYLYCSPEFYHIPLLITGGALKEEYRGIKDTLTAAQTDIAATLLHQLGLGSNNYIFSKNLFNPYTSRFAFYTFNAGFGFVQGNSAVVWNKKFPDFSINRTSSPAQKDSLQHKGAALLQYLMQDFLKK